jgi:uncharacterized protein YjbI with pentapeptide repeats
MRRNPIPREWGKPPVVYTHRVSRDENLAGDDLQDAVLVGSDLRGSNFRGANLQGASLYKCDLQDCDFTGANLDGANLTFATVDGAVFDGCSMRNTLLFDPYKLSTVEVFKPAENGLHVFGFVEEPEIVADEPGMLSHLRQSGEIPQYLELTCGLGGGDVAPPAINPKFVEKLVIPGEGDVPALSVIMVQPASSPDYINLSGMDLSGADFTFCFGDHPDEKTRFAMRHGNLRYTNLSGANLTMAVFYRSNFSHANLSGADLSGAAFQESDLSRANLSGAFGEVSVWDSTLLGADLRGLDKDSILYSDWHNVDFKGATADSYRVWSKALVGAQLRQLFPEM